MEAAVMARVHDADVVVQAAAVADFRPKEPPNRKLKKHEGIPEIVLEPTHNFAHDIAAAKRPGQVLVGFAAETDDLRENARGKFERMKLDLMVGNDVSQPDAGFEVDTNRVVLIDADGDEALPLLTKIDLAGIILDRVASFLDSNNAA